MINDKDEGFMDGELMNFQFQFPFAYLEYSEKVRTEKSINQKKKKNFYFK